MAVKAKQEAVIEFFLFEGCVSEEVVVHLRNVHGSAAHCQTSVFRRISKVRHGKEELRSEGPSGRHETDPAIRPVLHEDPNPLLRTIAETLSISPETVRTHMSWIGHTLKTLRWIPHALTSELK
jgi:hypothetical protein